MDYTGYITLGGINTVPHDIKFNLIYGKFLSGAFPVGRGHSIFFFVTKHSDCDLYKLYPTINDQFNIYFDNSPLLDDMLHKLKYSIIQNNKLNYFFIKNYNLHPLTKWSKGRVVLIGEAAQLVEPILGCATSIILEGTDELVNQLNANKDNYELAFSIYQKTHQPRANSLLALERKFTNKFMHNSLVNYFSFDEDLITCLKKSQK